MAAVPRNIAVDDIIPPHLKGGEPIHQSPPPYASPPITLSPFSTPKPSNTFDTIHGLNQQLTTTTTTTIPHPPLSPLQPKRKISKMPTPESPAYLSKKPTVPPTYEGVDFQDTAAVHAARDSIIREQWVRSMMSRLVGEELGKCYKREGVNHLEKCGVLRDKYFELLGERKIKGYLAQEKNYQDMTTGSS
ncbi:hypothetical protein AJ80_09984 [Polytolypa hystricis UAMH7299]|uniref:NADH-ubiquinone oxidoreductase 12 kDa subunit, mitochondrial n=1 Tax=Polytolypa hystricis (strain UAMH7299) TaxID=1447883 RepID=A0A2B7WF42_POLH7|nr:hypothetical protein AJ80_09984 [Polytolypa hystricis UAMH7299]